MSGYTLTGANGDVITFDNTTYVLNPSLIGFGIPPTSVRIDESARYGGIHRYTRRGVRNVDMPVTVLGTSATDVESKLRRLAKLTQDTAGPTKLTALRDDGDVFLELHYVGGAELEYGGDTGGYTWAKAMLSFQAPNPYWQSTDTESFIITSGNTGRGLLPQLSKLKVSSSQAIGIVNVDNDSDVPVYPVIRVAGPVDNLQVSLDGQGWTFTESVTTGEVYLVDHETATVEDAAEANRYDILGTSPKFFTLPPGTSAVLITGTNADANTQITVEYNLAYEVVHG